MFGKPSIFVMFSAFVPALTVALAFPSVATAGPEFTGRLTAKNAAEFCHTVENAEPKSARFALDIDVGDDGRRSVSYQFDTTKKQLTLWLKGEAFHEDCDVIIKGLKFGKDYFSSEDSPDHWIRVDVVGVRTKMLKGFFELEFRVAKTRNTKTNTFIFK